jgi:hypothetical protein
MTEEEKKEQMSAQTIKIYISKYPDGIISVSEVPEGEYIIGEREIQIPKPQEKVEEQMLNNQMRLDGWIGWLQARIPELKKGANEFWLKQALESYKDAHLANTLQDNGLREATEKVVMYYNEGFTKHNSVAKNVRFDSAIGKLEKALNQNK